MKRTILSAGLSLIGPVLLLTSLGAMAAISIEPHSPRVKLDQQLEQAWQAWQSGHLEVAQTLYQQVMRSEPKNQDALLGLAAIHMHQGNDTLATHQLSLALQLNPRDPTALAGLSALNGWDQTEGQLRLLLDQYPDSAALHFALGLAHGERQRWGAAHDAFSRAHHLRPADWAPLLNLAISLDHMGKSREAIAHYRRVLRMNIPEQLLDGSPIAQRLQQLEAAP